MWCWWMTSSAPVKHSQARHNYYATQVLHHFEGEMWDAWNQRMRDPLIAAQVRQGHEAGSWFFPNDRHDSVAGGRLCCTSLAAMTLEVYYRHMPLYSKKIKTDKLDDNNGR
jgi:hypothetical protein